MASTDNIQNGASSSSSSCSEYQWEYEVFLNFGGDTRNNFTDHLYHALATDKGIKTFRDNEELETGKPISSELLKAIEKSRIAVVVLSEKYASSSWCLEELEKILECKDAGRMGVRPIFYHVDPSDVRHLKGTFAAAFAKHVLAIFHHVNDESFKENVDGKMQRWRAALRRVAHLSGHHLKNNESESQFIRKFVGGISSELKGTIIGSVYQNKYACKMLKALNSCIDNLCVFRNTLKEPTVYRRFPIYHDEVGGIGGSYAKDPHPDNKISKTAHNLDFHPLLSYNSCFLPSKVTQEWFSQQSRGQSHRHWVTIDIPPNLCDDNDWKGLALYALFSINENQEDFQCNLMSEIPQFLYCQLGTSVAGLDNEILACHTSGAEIEWLNNQGEFIWICYVPREPLMHMFRQCSRIEASFVSDWPGVVVQECVLRLLYLNDQLQFQQNMKQCNLILEKSDFASQFRADQEKRNGQNLDDEAGPPTTSSSNGDYFKRRPIYQGKTNEDFDRCLIYNSCFPQIEIVDWFSHQSDEPRVRILLPQNLYDDTTWTGLALFAFFSILDHSTTLIGNLDSQVRCRLGFLSQNSNFCLESLHSYCLTQEDISLLKLGGFVWLSYIPRGQFPKWLSRCSSIEAKISDCPGLTVHKCGLHLLYQNDEEEFKETIRLFKASFSNNNENEAKAGPSNSANDQDSHHERLISNEDFDGCLIYNSCFPQSEVIDWFSNQSDGPRVTILLPPNLYDDTTWTGLALFAFFPVLDHSTTLIGSLYSQVHCRLGFLSQNRNFCLESLHSYCLTQEDISLLKLGGFMWLSYIPRGQFPKWLNRCSSIEVEICDCPGWTVQKCGLHILYQNDEEFFKEIFFKTHLYNKYENEANKFYGGLVFNSCFPPNEILGWFSHRSDGPKVRISVPPPPESLWEHDVFLSFRGGDTRTNFTGHLYTALRDKEIVTFRDMEGLETGKPILELLNAIEKSRMAVVILSENYASSTWCLEELAKIVECMDAGRMRVFPIFYHVDIHDVRLLKGTFEAAFAKHDKRSKEKKEKEDAFANHDERSKEEIEKVQRWRSALRRVADLSGHHLNDEPESEFICSFVEKVSSELNGTTESVYKEKYVGIKSCVKEIVNGYIEMEPKDDVRFIGICGMSGIGKTTLAEAVFERIHHQFEASSFLRDVKGRDLNDSQDQLLWDMKLKSEIPRWDKLKAINTTSLRLRKKRVIIVVDDADEKGLETLAGHRDWFGQGSRIILTTEDKGLLEKRCGEKNVYKTKKLSAYDALQLFIRQAFNEPPCGKDLLDICNGFVRYVDGHPLALKILGSSMYGITNIDQWEAELERVRKCLELPKDERNIQKVLRMSYNRLSTPKKKLFLDVACFLNGEDKDRISDILEDPGKCIPEIDIKALIDKSLITALGGKLWIHNLLQQMGWEIVNEECMEKRSRLWLEEDVLEVLNNGKGTDSVEGILLNAPAHKQVRLNADAFSKMKNLRLLRICTAHLPQGLNYLSNELHLLEWHEYPLKSMPRSFQPNKLVELLIPGSLIEQLPEEFSNLGKLKVINLRDSQNLNKTPDFTRLSNLERVIFQGCTRLEELHPSIGVHKRITQLNLKDCKCLDRLPPEINLESLKTLVLSGCSRLKKFPEIGRNMTSLWELYLDRTAIEELPLSIVHLTGLSVLNLQDCNNFSSFPRVICSLTSLQTLILSGFKVQPEPNSLLIKSLSGLSSLVSLDLSDCNVGDGALPDDISSLSSLQSLNLSKNHFTCLPESISQLPKLKVLYLDNCSRLESLANIPLSTQSVMARHCTSLINYSNQIIVWTSGEPGLTFINCLNSADDIDEESKGRELSLRDIHFKPLLQRYMEGQIRQVDGMYSISPQTEIPKWFTYQNKSGSSVPIRLPDHQDENYSSWRGIALFIVFKVKNIVPRGHDSKSFHEFIYHFDNDGGLQDYPLIIINVPKDKLYALSYGLRLYVSNARFRDHLDERGCISPSITVSSSDVEIQKCGARLVYEEDMVEFVQNLTQETSGSPEHLRPHQESIEYPMNPSPSNVDEPEPSLSSGQTDSNSRKKRQHSGQSYSSPRLNRQLKSLLSLLYQGDPARYHCYEYIFPQVKMAAPPRWFNYQNVSSVIKMELPSNLNDNTRWLGFTVFALFTLPKQPACSGDNQEDSMIFVTFSDVLGGDLVGDGMGVALSRDLFVGSHRLLMFYMPREGFKLNGNCSHIWAAFQSDNPSVDITMCGIRAVYEEDVDEFVQALVECFVGCPDAYHDSIYGNLLNQVAMSQGCKHGEDFRCNFASQRWPQSTLQLLPSSIENVEEEEDCTSQETFPNQEFEAAGTSRNSRLSKITLGIPFRDGHSGTEETKRMLHTWSKRYVQDHCNDRGIYNHCFPEREIPKWFCHQNKGNSVTTSIPQNLFSDRNWMGFAICAVFPFHKHPTAVRRNLLESGFLPHRVICELQTDIDGMNPISTSYSISEDEVLISLYQRAFLWLSFTPSGNWMGEHVWNQMSWAKFSFVSDTPDVSSAVKCGVNLVYRHNFDEFTRTIVQLLTSYADYMHLIRNSSKKNEPTVYKMLPMYHENVPRPDSSYEEDPRPRARRRVPIQPFHPEHSSVGRLGTPKPFYQTGPLDFNPLLLYNNCFPPNKEAQEWFTDQSGGHSVAIEIPPNLYNDTNWMGVALCVCFSIDGDRETLLENMVSEIPQFLYCQFRRTVAGMDDELSLSCVTSKAEITWLLNVGEFIWISYVPGESFKNMLRQCSRIEGSFLNDWPGVMVKECGLRLLYQRDLVEFEQNLKQCNALIYEHLDFARQFMADQEKSNRRQNPDDEAARPSMVPYNSIDDFHRHLLYNSCFPQSGGIILDWFSHPSDGPKVGIPLPPNFYNDPTWTGLALFASFSVLFGSPDSQVHCRFVFASENGTFGVGHPHSYCLHEDDLCLLNLDGFIWLVYLPREWFPKWLNRCSSIEAEISNCPAGLTVDKCGLHLLYQNDEEFFKEILFKTHLYNKYENEANKFDGCLVYNSCFPPNEILERFSHRSDEPQLTISLPPNLYDDPSWIGLALCVSFSLQKDGTTIVDNRDSQLPCNLICLLETDIGSLDSPHVYSLTKENLVLLRLGGFIWLSHIPRGSFPNWLNQSSFIEASITTAFPSLTVHKCGFRLLYQNEEIEFKETIRHYTASLSTTWNVNHQYSTIANEKMVKSNQEDKAAESSTTSISDEDSHLDPRLKDKSKNDHPHIKNQDFDRCLVYNSCFPPNDILDWFSHQSDEPQLTISLPSNLYNDSTWMGLALCVSFLLQDDGTIIVDNLDSQLLPCNLICYLETNIGSLEPLHKYCLTKDHHLKLLQLGGFIWLSFIPRVSFLNCLNQQSSFIEASVAIDCLGLTVQKCGFRLLYQNDEVEFKETIRRLSQTWDLIHQENTAKPNEEDKAAEPNTTSSSDDPKPKDKGKRIVE